jgi:hypothetical protein
MDRAFTLDGKDLFKKPKQHTLKTRMTQCLLVADFSATQERIWCLLRATHSNSWEGVERIFASVAGNQL